MAYDEKEFVNHMFNHRVTFIEFDRAIDAFWGKVAREVFIPTLIKIYDKMVETRRVKGARNISWGDADGDLYYIPNDDRKVIVFTSQTYDYLFVLDPIVTREYFSDAPAKEKFGKELKTHTLHIRRIWRTLKKDSIHNQDKILSNIKSALDAVETLSEYSDDHSLYPQRPSLNLYSKIDFSLNEFHDKPRFFGDLRDPGYILSCNNRFFLDRVEGAKYALTHLQSIAQCNLGVMASELDVKLEWNKV